MTNEEKRELRQVANTAKDNFMPNFMIPTRQVIALLDELVVLEKRIAELESNE